MIKAPTMQGDVTIDIPDWNNNRNCKNLNVGMRISGGADSAIIAYMLAIYVRDFKPHLKIHPITCEHPGKPYQIIFAKKVIEKITELTGVKFEEHSTLIIPGKGSYADEQRVLLDKLYNDNIIDCHFMGETLNPPLAEMNKFIEPDMPPERNVPEPVADLNGKRFRPLRQSHKKSVHDLYKHLGVLETLFPVTRSCEAYTTDFAKHCEWCSFCQERFWGFGRYV
jgi:hypothetical protein